MSDTGERKGLRERANALAAAGDMLRRNLSDSFVWHPENFHADGLEQVLQAWDIEVSETRKLLAADRREGERRCEGGIPPARCVLEAGHYGDHEFGMGEQGVCTCSENLGCPVHFPNQYEQAAPGLPQTARERHDASFLDPESTCFGQPFSECPTAYCAANRPEGQE